MAILGGGALLLSKAQGSTPATGTAAGNSSTVNNSLLSQLIKAATQKSSGGTSGGSSGGGGSSKGDGGGGASLGGLGHSATGTKTGSVAPISTPSTGLIGSLDLPNADDFLSSLMDLTGIQQQVTWDQQVDPLETDNSTSDALIQMDPGSTYQAPEVNPFSSDNVDATTSYAGAYGASDYSNDPWNDPSGLSQYAINDPSYFYDGENDY